MRRKTQRTPEADGKASCPRCYTPAYHRNVNLGANTKRPGRRPDSRVTIAIGNHAPEQLSTHEPPTSPQATLPSAGDMSPHRSNPLGAGGRLGLKARALFITWEEGER